MKYLKNFLLFFVIILVFITIYLAVTEGWSSFFFFPILIIVGYTVFYLHNQFEREEKEHLEKEIKLAKEDLEADIWLENTLVPQTISYGKNKRKIIIFYSFLFLAGVYFLWSYISYGLEVAIRDLILASLIFWLFIIYFYSVPFVSKKISSILPTFLKNRNYGDWGRAYFFLFPVSFFIYLVYPVESILQEFQSKLFSFPVFFLTYTFSFLGLYSIAYIYNDMKKEEKKKLEEDIKDSA